VQPDTLGHALRIPGVTPAAVAVLGAYIGRFRAAQSPASQTEQV
jgi:tRNA U34 5-carboxymethylaminomethyl modifying enzyme MnmG/GidA